ncbi:DUF3422 family protein [Seohaeicola zhoushanensis]|uniref:DUF3422 domain-containing protein n=1 Tax=Seohaeicola zhoushanensis TaxID=1569283 RepID=A0A8J3GYX7_9RHOB|nr:DUF3422 domain-containing protein [Seohaeicola zhoushanensis]GHF60154.1 hypothetical protein GCM10017056_34510 [Seohaeicola zhoushanensis]
MSPIIDHPLRYELTNELHARPFPSISVPATVVFLAVKQPVDAAARDRAADVAHLVQLLDRHGAAHPQPGATHYSGQIGRHVLKWEQHAEFVTYTAFSEGLSTRPFDPADFEVFPADWLDDAPGQRITSVVIRLERRGADETVERLLGDWFVPESLAVARVLDDAAIVAGDFRIDTGGHMRFALFAEAETGARRIGRVVQRLCEIETYKAMSMLGFSRARGLSGKIGGMETKLNALMVEMTDNVTGAEETLNHLLTVAAEIETTATQAAFRFGATGAYEAIVNQRIAALREARFLGRQTFSEFMMRRYEPAMRTVKATERRLGALAERAMRTGDLLRTRVDVERSAQNQALLASMDRRADLALRLQETVEGLSVVAISYYAVSLAGYLLYPVAEATGLGKNTLVAMVTLPVVALVWWMVHRMKKRIG